MGIAHFLLLAALVGFGIAPAYAQNECNLPKLRSRVDVTPRQFGCDGPCMCILGPEDVRHLPPPRASIGVKTVGTDRMTDNGHPTNMKMFDIFEIGMPMPTPLARPGSSIWRVDGFFFYDEQTLRAYIGAKKPGEEVSVMFVNRQEDRLDERFVRVVEGSRVPYKSKINEYVTFEEAVSLARKQSLRAFIGATSEIAPYMMLYALSQAPIESLDLDCIRFFGQCVEK